MKKLKKLNGKQIEELEKKLIEKKDNEVIIEEYLNILYDLEKIYIYIEDEKKLKDNKAEIFKTLDLLFDDEI